MDRGVRSTSWPTRFASGKENDARYMRCRMDASIVQNFIEKRNTPSLVGIQTPDRQSVA